MATVLNESTSSSVQDFVLSPTSALRSRTFNLQKVSEEVKISTTFPNFCTVHWDTKLLGELGEHLAVVVSGDFPIKISEKLLGVPDIDSSSGMNQANGILGILRDWNLQRKVFALCFDTTSSNTGVFNGAAVILERLLNRKCLWLACRHHTMEVMEAGVCSSIFGKSTAPDNPLFKTFKNKWDSLDKSMGRLVRLPESTWLNIRKNLIIERLQNIPGRFCRDDYREMINVALVLLGEPNPDVLRKPGPIHHARWMSRVLYFGKMLIFSCQLDYSEDFIEKLNRLAIFNCLLYTASWFDSSECAAHAPANDIRLYIDLHRFKLIDSQIATAALDKLKNHLWYLTPEMLTLSLFGTNVPAATKSEMANRLLEVKPLSCQKQSVMKKGKPKFPELIIETVSLVNLIEQKSWFIFQALNIDTNWLYEPVDTWNENADFSFARNVVMHLKVVNDGAERAVKLVEDYCDKVTKDPEMRQNLLQSVEHHRKQFSEFKKSAFVKK